MVDYLIVTFIREEYEAVWQLFRDSAEKIESDVPGTTRVVSVRTKVGDSVKVAIGRTSNIGNLSALEEVIRFIDEQQPRLVLTAGIAGAVPTSDVCLGDVVLGNEVHNLTLSAETASGREEAVRGSYQSKAVRHFVANVTNDDFEALHDRAAKLTRPAVGELGKSSTDGDSWNEKIEMSLKATKNRTVPKVVDGVIASSDSLVKSNEFMKNRLHVDRRILINEMESAGAAIACENRDVPLLILRSVSDIIGHVRSDDWKWYACDVLAICAWDVVQLGAVERITAKLQSGDQDIAVSVNEVVHSLDAVLFRLSQGVTHEHVVDCREAFDLFRLLPSRLKRKCAPGLFETLDKPMKYLGDKKFVIEVAKECIECCSGTELDDAALECQARAMICGTSWALQRTGQLGKAEDEARASMQISEGIGAHRNLAFCKKCLGRLLRMRAEVETNAILKVEFLNESVRHLREAINSFGELDEPDEAEVGDCYSLLGRTYLVTRDFDEAQYCASEARVRIQADSKDRLDLLILEGEIRVATGEYSSALALFDEAIESVIDDGYQISEIVARAHLQKAHTLMQLDQIDEADASYANAQAIWEHYGEDHFAAEAEWGRILASGMLKRRAIRQLGAQPAVVRCLAVDLYKKRSERRGQRVVAQRGGTDDAAWKRLIKDAKHEISLRTASS
ncbi:MAG: hypothetical protein OXG25_09485 [Gammaproteobacteria bacterium]|nr:hypothetical protein [Gammaproteobacteria bacterium]